jgi:glycine cleavage system regulatory protein
MGETVSQSFVQAPEDLVMSVLAVDRPGLVSRLAALVAEHQGNWIDSSMSRLAGAFAGIVHIHVPTGHLAALEAALVALGEEGIKVLVSRANAPSLQSQRLASVELTCRDRPGLVRDISTVLARRHVSIEQLETEVFEASMAGGHMFSAIARIRLPETVEVDDLLNDFEELGGDVLADVVLRAED